MYKIVGEITGDQEEDLSNYFELIKKNYKRN